MDSRGTKEKNRGARCDRFPAGCVNLRGFGSAIRDDFGDFGTESLQARHKLACAAIASRKQDAFARQFGRELVGEGRGGSTLAHVSDIETGQLCGIGGGFSDGGGSEGS